MSLVSHRNTPLLYIQKKLRIAPCHERFRNAPNIRNPAPRQLLCAFAWLIPHVWRSENVCKCSCEHGICSRFPRCFLHICQEAVVLDISVSAAVFNISAAVFNNFNVIGTVTGVSKHKSINIKISILTNLLKMIFY